MATSIFELPGTDTEIVACGLLLPPEQTSRAIDLSKEVASYNQVKFTLNAQTHPPYVRLYETILPKANLQEAHHRIKEVADSMICFHMEWGEVEQAAHFTIIWGKLNETLKVFHQTILVTLNHLREGNYKQKYLQKQQLFSPEEQQSLERWGSPWAEPYLPHLVITKGRQQIEYKKPLEWKFERCLFPGLILGHKGSSGDFTDLQEYTFKENTGL